MKNLIILILSILFFSGCFNNDISSLSRNDCIKQGFKYKINKRLNFRSGSYEVESICYKNS